MIDNPEQHKHSLGPIKIKNLYMAKSFTLIQTVATAGLFSAVSFWYGFMFGRETSRKELGDLIADLRRQNPHSSSSSNPPHS